MLPTLYLLLGAFAATAAHAQATQRAAAAEPSHVPNTYFVRLRNTTADGGRAGPKLAFHRQCAEKAVAYDVRYEYDDADLFYGLSVSLSTGSDLDALKSIPEVTHISPVRWIPRPEIDSSVSGTAAAFDSNHDRVARSATARAKRAAPGAAVDFNAPHRLTGVSALHAAGIRGAGVKVALIDSGVDYRHPALGGCFGAGCKFTFGYDLVGDAYNGAGNPVATPSPDPLTACLGGFHGTHVAGILGMEAPANDTLFSSLVGVAPDAELGMYRVFGCSGGASEDVIVAAMQRAAADGAQLLSLSLGGYAAWGGDAANPYVELVAGLKRRGVAVIVAAGNYGESGPFALGNPAIVPEALAVAAVENSEFPTYGVRDAATGASHRYGALYPFPGGTYTAVVAGDGSAESEFGCYDDDYAGLRANTTGDPSDYVVVVRRGWCPVTVSQERAVANNFTKILTFPDPDSPDDIFIQAYGVPVVALDGDGEIVSIGSTTDSKIYDAIKAAEGEVKLSFADKTPVLEKQYLGGLINSFSSIGPSWDFSLKPQIAAPGGNIVSTYPLGGGGWAIASGTSMAAPYLSGVYALIKSQTPDLSVDAIFDILKTTAKPIAQAGQDSTYSPTQQQGAGLVAAAAALSARTAVSPSQFELGGTETLATLNTSITLRNPTDADVTYTLGHVPANGMAFYPYGNSAPDQKGWTSAQYLKFTPLSFAASVTFPSAASNTITVPAGGGAATVDFAVAPPAGLDPREIPVYSGFITATADSGNATTFSIPYVGAPYDYAAAPLIGLDPPTANARDANRSVFAAPQVYRYSTGLAQGNHAAYEFRDSDSPVLRYSLLQPTRWTRVDVVDAAAADHIVPTWYGFDPAQAVTNYTRTSMRPNGTVAGGVEVLGSIYLYSGDTPLVKTTLEWSFPIRDITGTTYIGLKKGGYRLLVSWLRFGGDEEKAEDWDSWLSGVIEATRDAYESPVTV